MSQFIPQGIEVLVKKAAVDPAFKAVLLDRRAAAAKQIGLELNTAETIMLGAVPAAQLEAIIAGTTVPQEHRRAFLGQAAAAMLAALGIVGSVQAVEPPDRLMPAPGGIPPDRIPASEGIRPDRRPPPDPKPDNPPDAKPATTESRVIDVAVKQFKVSKDKVTSKTSFVKDLNATTAGLIKLRKGLDAEFGVTISSAEFKKMQTVGDAVETIDAALKKKADESKPPAPKPIRGTQPDRPPTGTTMLGVRPQE
jgi:acyl carrier protein